MPGHEPAYDRNAGENLGLIPVAAGRTPVVDN